VRSSIASWHNHRQGLFSTFSDDLREVRDPRGKRPRKNSGGVPLSLVGLCVWRHLHFLFTKRLSNHASNLSRMER
jgi:hypothetical protein